MVSNLYFSYSLNTLLLTVSCKHELTIPQLSEYIDCSTVGKYLTSPFYFPALTPWNPVRTAQKIQKSQTLKSQKVIKTKMFLFYVPGEIVRVKSVFNGFEVLSMSPPFRSKKVKTDGGRSDLLLIAVARFIFSSSSPWPLPHSLCSFVLFFFSSTFPFHPCIFHFYLICSFIVYFLSRFSLLPLLCFFSNLSFSPIPSFSPPLPFLFFPFPVRALSCYNSWYIAL